MTAVDSAAADFGRHTKGGGGWALGLAVASCVEPDTGHGKRSDRNVSKVSAREFAAKAGTSAARVLRYFEAWQRAASQGVVCPASELVPTDWDDVDHIPTGYEWSDFFDAGANGGSRVSADPERAIAQVIERHGTDAVAEAVVGNEKLDSAVSRTRLDRVISGEDREALAAGAREAKERLDSAIGASHAGLADHVDHEVELELITVEAHLRRAVSKLQAFPYVSESQRQRLLATLDRIDQYVEILRGGGALSDADRAFLESVGVES